MEFPLEDLLLELLNSTPVVDGVVHDLLGDDGRAVAWQWSHGGAGDEEERRHLVRARDLLQDVVRGDQPPTALAPLLDGVVRVPRWDDDGLEWVLSTDSDRQRRLAVRAVTAWDAVRRDRPGRLRPCANPECRRFLLDRSKPNKARWCSMAVCGNRMKARRHYERVRESG
jgi:predicted RNA-binding Zn ribbon-like protein